MQLPYTLYSGAGNRFVVLDLFVNPPPSRPAELARQVCASNGSLSFTPRPDGLLLARPGTRGGQAAMELYNADGSRAETCGNGLRCLAKLVSDRRYVGGEEFVLEADAGLCPTRVERTAGVVTRVRVAMGAPREALTRERLTLKNGAQVEAVLVNMGNPHCVLLVDDERLAPVLELGAELERHARFPRGTNVEFLALRAEGAFLRVFERGVGETAACGSGACAAAAAAQWLGKARLPLTLHLPGGQLEISADAQGGLYLFGPAQEHESATLEWADA
jgi:diaminopimelate epimerase